MSSLILRDDASGVVVDLHRAPAAGDTTAALAAMTALDGGAVANMDEHRMVGHYWLRNPDLAPTAAIRDTITATLEQIRAFAPGPFKTLVQIGVGGSALGPELANDALRGADAPEFEVLDTVDPVAVSEFLARIDPEHTLVIVASKSGSTIETSIATDLVEAHFERCGVSFADRAIAVTIPGSRLAERARDATRGPLGSPSFAERAALLQSFAEVAAAPLPESDETSADESDAQSLAELPDPR